MMERISPSLAAARAVIKLLPVDANGEPLMNETVMALVIGKAFIEAEETNQRRARIKELADATGWGPE